MCRYYRYKLAVRYGEFRREIAGEFGQSGAGEMQGLHVEIPINKRLYSSTSAFFLSGVGQGFTTSYGTLQNGLAIALGVIRQDISFYFLHVRSCPLFWLLINRLSNFLRARKRPVGMVGAILNAGVCRCQASIG